MSYPPENSTIIPNNPYNDQSTMFFFMAHAVNSQVSQGAKDTSHKSLDWCNFTTKYQ